MSNCNCNLGFFWQRKNNVKTRLFEKKASLLIETTWNDCPLTVVSKTIFHGCDTIVVLFLFPCLSLTEVKKREKNVLIIKNTNKRIGYIHN